uniref:Methyltransf_21 domain-containing protein n=1 Tax=Steinernema glaseri TaxID=37863 RepID=A0A1I8AGY4_9BILA
MRCDQCSRRSFHKRRRSSRCLTHPSKIYKNPACPTFPQNSTMTSSVLFYYLLLAVVAADLNPRNRFPPFDTYQGRPLYLSHHDAASEYVTSQKVNAIPEKMESPSSIAVPKEEDVSENKEGRVERKQLKKLSAGQSSGGYNNSIKIDIKTSTCFGAGTDTRVSFWFNEMEFSAEKVIFNTDFPLLGPFDISGWADELGSGCVDHIEASDVQGNTATIEHSMKVMILKMNLIFPTEIASQWKPEYIMTRWQSSNSASYERPFLFDVDCNKGWIAHGDYYVVTSSGITSPAGVYRLMDTKDLSIHELLANYHYYTKV